MEQKEKTPLVIVSEELAKIEKKFVELTNKETWEREKSYAIQLFRKNPTLQKANLRSTMEAIINVANIGLTLNPTLKLAYLLPRFGNGTIECCLEASYQGLVKLITDTGSAKNVYCHIVYEGDEFQETLGTTIEIKHVPKRQSRIIQCVYAVAILNDGSKQVEVMSKAEIDEIKERSESFKAVQQGKIKSCPWMSDEGEMSRKTVIRRLCKYLPKTEQWEKLAKAIKLDEVDYTISDNQIDFIEQLLMHACISPEEKQQIEGQMFYYTSIQANEIITRLKEAQVDPIEAGNNYSQSDITKKLNELK